MATGVSASYMLATRRSQYHEKCGPRDIPPAPVTTGQGVKESDFNKCDQVTQDVIWKQSVLAERRCVKNWEGDWGFLTEYDAKGQVKEKEELPEKSVMFSDHLPNTNSGNYGHRLNSAPGQQMQGLEHKFFSEGRRRKLPRDLICY